MDGYKKRTLQKMESIEKSTTKLLSLPLNDIKIADIAKLANVSQVSIYNYYGSKEALLKATIIRLMDHQYEETKQMLSSDISFKEKIKELFIRKKKGLDIINLEMFTALMKKDPELQELVLDFTMNKSFKLLVSLIDEGRSLGLVRNEVQNKTLLIYIQVLSQAFLNMDQTTSQYIQQKEVVDEMMNIFLYGLLKQED
ncbi:TetR/AcrR family transcriptional regulator [Gottfriedia acidiceleris]|uniref:TetR/AcrR family transcriptional regulator n=1 Tax=Gottfriedia acidiceleris TaxID=371036 RepID=A0ABY4JJC5_9BACI|nr:TetR/AcrR family transcriptional regulator [Gottfriedia acidiceleris]UPM53944.1 TetR/AcrR family transcriptional regulator [Gottfriedia acidiceleris]